MNKCKHPLFDPEDGQRIYCNMCYIVSSEYSTVVNEETNKEKAE